MGILRHFYVPKTGHELMSRVLDSFNKCKYNDLILDVYSHVAKSSWYLTFSATKYQANELSVRP